MYSVKLKSRGLIFGVIFNSWQSVCSFYVAVVSQVAGAVLYGFFLVHHTPFSASITTVLFPGELRPTSRTRTTVKRI